MKQLPQLRLVIFLAIALSFAACDPGHSGKMMIHNDSSATLKLHYKTHTKDTTITIHAYSSADVLHFGGLGEGRKYNCCPCEFMEVTLQPTDASLTVTKDILKLENWNMTNPNKRRFSSKEINCEFRVTQADIQ